MIEIAEELPISTLLRWAAMPPTYADALDLVELGRDVDRNGVKEPVILHVNIFDKTIRLDTGNHRVYMMPLMGWTHLPCVARVSDTSVGDPANGNHWYHCDRIILPPHGFEQEYYARVSTVLDI